MPPYSLLEAKDDIQPQIRDGALPAGSAPATAIRFHPGHFEPPISHDGLHLQHAIKDVLNDLQKLTR